jgi:putative membrane protein
MSRFKIASVLAAVLFATAGAAHADIALDLGDKRFVREAGNAGVYETQAAQVAMKRARSPKVKAYARMLLKDHEKANDELRRLAASKSVELQRELPQQLRGRVQALERAKPDAFDRDFIQKVGLDDHASDIELFERDGLRATDGDVKAFSEKTLPVLKAHRAEAQTLLDGLKR